MIDIDNAASLSSLAALLLHLQAEVFNLEGGQIYINSLSQLSLSTYMRLSMDTLKALQIFKEDYHPNLIKGISHLQLKSVNLLSKLPMSKGILQAITKKDFQSLDYSIELGLSLVRSFYGTRLLIS
jgi:hypothetical protein